ncbi:MAG: hypothetical protein A3D52_02000 [Candidatus Taylorbacteria bacterium RIFCSPHIGHO2_02_FULL_44_36]|uniref:DUF11 domain-containing protein n=1 Tax=Candidatus Taylorbacteria bacterium RIFCSPLOWO2_12_FULL_44_15c TaxID=1802333 RepID=A0A1G2P6U6_9BACT|nr:MAG: hypothetical protein A3D52_02000 [Candidatus Taylorbacteria bacterium RIFCSPHIGHO2_02_FULL_44_36]OHA37944.1 MAG: hypothetical protein A3I97_02775 [Candidatus Taylorbacteria bacterium RIFCSPLOWO2_02_FULL_44_35]OHA43362.1 MAG: hypothetical protein A3G03_03285 [Candidatus Taylorbacteria bacterium RIFCSPLOWO2_12_FULL_44_15c]
MFRPKEEKSGLEKLQEKIYSNQGDVDKERREFQDDNAPAVKGDWNDGGLPKYLFMGAPIRGSLVKYFFIAAAVFFLVSAGFAGYMFLGGGQTISGNNVNISVAGPVSIGGGEELPLTIIIDNQNPAAMGAVDLVIEFPAGTRQAGDVGKEFLRQRETIGTIASGESVRREIRAVLFGQEKETKEIVVSVEYRVPGSSALLFKEKKFEIVLSSAPVAVAVNAPTEISAGLPFELVVSIASNSENVIENLLLKVEYGFGFIFSDSEPKSLSGGNTWRLGDLKPGSKRTIKIRGRFEGQNEEEKVFRFTVGTADKQDEKLIGTAFLTANQAIILKKPAVGVSIVLNGDTVSKEIVTAAGSQIRADLLLNNNSATPAESVEILAALAGSAFNRFAVTTDGYYRSTDNLVVWNKNTTAALTQLDPGAKTSLSLGLIVLDMASLISAGITNPTMIVDATVKGQTVAGGKKSDFSAKDSKTIKISSELSLDAKLTYYDGPFQNKGPIPPKTDTETFYTVTLKIANAVNNASNVSVTGRLPLYARFLGVVSPQTENLVFNQLGGMIIWNVGKVSALAGFTGSAREVSFQIAVLPSITHIGSSPLVMTNIEALGDDDFTGEKLNGGVNDLTTDLRADSRAKSLDGVVVR